jgi:hypothetical protein
VSPSLKKARPSLVVSGQGFAPFAKLSIQMRNADGASEKVWAKATPEGKLFVGIHSGTEPPHPPLIAYVQVQVDQGRPVTFQVVKPFQASNRVTVKCPRAVQPADHGRWVEPQFIVRSVPAHHLTCGAAGFHRANCLPVPIGPGTCDGQGIRNKQCQKRVGDELGGCPGRSGWTALPGHS